MHEYSSKAGVASGKRYILLAEDNPGDVMLVREALSQHGIDFEFVHFPDGEGAVDYLDTTDGDGQVRCPELAILDLHLPRVTGDIVFRRIRQSPRYGDIPVIILTASDAPQDRDSISDLGSSVFFRKPTDLTEFLKLGSVVQSLFQSKT
jgi:CheY-like chemotaxis protein